MGNRTGVSKLYLCVTVNIQGIITLFYLDSLTRKTLPYLMLPTPRGLEN
jgi:hypothetical protein